MKIGLKKFQNYCLGSFIPINGSNVTVYEFKHVVL